VTSILETRWQISGDAVDNAVGDEVVILHLTNGTYFGLDAVGALLWRGLKAGETPLMVRDRILDAYDVDQETAEKDLAKFMHELIDGQLITPC